MTTYVADKISSSGNILLDATSNVGVGNNSPGYKLDVTGTINASVEVRSASFNTTSDRNKKQNIETITGALDIIDQIRGVRFNWKEDNKPSMGVIAQEIEEVLPELVSTSANDEKTVSYGNFVGVLIQAIKEQSEIINQLKTRIENLENKE